MTVYDIESISLVSKEYRNIITTHPVIYKTVIDRDYKDIINNNNVKTSDINFLFSFCLGIETGNICYFCNKMKDNCVKGCSFKSRISKTDCKSMYGFSDKELTLFKSESIYIAIYKKYGTIYRHSDIMCFLLKKHGGMTNFLVMNKLNHEKKLKAKLDLQEKRRLKNLEFDSWRHAYFSSNAIYTHLTPEQRKIMLVESLKKQDINLRNDSLLGKGFINGSLTAMSLEHIVALIKMTTILFSYSYVIFSEYHDECKNAIIRNMFDNRNRKCRVYTWLDAVDNVHKKYKLRFSKIRNYYNGYNNYDSDSEEYYLTL